MSSDIFIQIASYCDPELLPTIRNALAQAVHPEKLSFGICFQQSAESPEYKELICIPNCRVIQIEPENSKGACWARMLTQSLWQGEEYTLQIDSHMRFADGWDEMAINMLKACGERAVLTAYCDEYVPAKPPKEHWTAYTLAAHLFSYYGALLLCCGVRIENAPCPVQGAFWSAHFSFSKGKFIEDVPYDPNLYFHGEEISIAVRAWTKGYNIFYPNRAVCCHHYNRIGRSLHWTDNSTWYTRDVLSTQRMRRLLGVEKGGEDFGKYGLGTERTLAQYEKFSGVNFTEKSISDNAYSGWYSDAPPRTGTKTEVPAQDIIFVTAFLEIGRGSWTDFRRSKSLYYKRFSRLAGFKNIKLVCYAEEQMWSELPSGDYSLRKFDKKDTFFDAYYDEEKAIMESDAFKKLIGARVLNPEHSKPDYSMMTHSKANFIRRAKAQFPSHEYYAWIDFGIVRQPVEPDTLFDFSRLLDDKIHMQVFNVPDNFSSDPITLCRESPDALSASMFVVPSSLVEWYESTYEEELKLNHHMQIADDEQNIMLRIAQKYPDKICADIVEGWFDFFLKSF